MLTVQVESGKVEAELKRLPIKVTDAVNDTMQTRIVTRFMRHLQTRHLSGQSLGVRTGTTRRAVFHRVERTGTTTTGVIGVDINKAPGARVLEEGGTIRPRGRALAVPLDPVRTGSGVARFEAKDVLRSASRFGYVGSFIRKNVIFGVKSDGDLEPLFALKKSVTIKPVGYLAATAEELTPWANKTLEDSVAKAVGSK